MDTYLVIGHILNCRWRREYGGMNKAQAKRLKELEKENTRLKKPVADISLDKYIRECLAVCVSRRLTSQDVLPVLMDIFIQRGIPVHIRSDNGSEFTAKKFAASWQDFKSSRCSLHRAVPGRMVILSRSMEK